MTTHYLQSEGRVAEGGIFLDVGAHDGKTLNETWPLERRFGWTGVCVEANPHEFKRLNHARKCETVCALVADVAGREVEFRVPRHRVDRPMRGSLLGGMAQFLGPTESNNPEDFEHSDMFRTTTTTLEEVLAHVALPRPRIDYMTVHTNGSELAVLRGMDWDRHPVAYVVVHHGGHATRRARVAEFLSSRGFRRVVQGAQRDEFQHK
jgi:hypothetical protein